MIQSAVAMQQHQQSYIQPFFSLPFGKHSNERFRKYSIKKKRKNNSDFSHEFLKLSTWGLNVKHMKKFTDLTFVCLLVAFLTHRISQAHQSSTLDFCMCFDTIGIFASRAKTTQTYFSMTSLTTWGPFTRQIGAWWSARWWGRSPGDLGSFTS